MVLIGGQCLKKGGIYSDGSGNLWGITLVTKITRLVSHDASPWFDEVNEVSTKCSVLRFI